MERLEKAIYLACKTLVKYYDDLGTIKTTKPSSDSVHAQNKGIRYGDNGPECIEHDRVMKLRRGQYGEFYSCGFKDANGEYCKSHAKV